MTLKEAMKLKVGQRVRWPEGANGCTEAFGLVDSEGSPHDLNKFVRWDNDKEGERTYLHDKDAVKYIEEVPYLTREHAIALINELVIAGVITMKQMNSSRGITKKAALREKAAAVAIFNALTDEHPTGEEVERMVEV